MKGREKKKCEGDENQATMNGSQEKEIAKEKKKYSSRVVVLINFFINKRKRTKKVSSYSLCCSVCASRVFFCVKGWKLFNPLKVYSNIECQA